MLDNVLYTIAMMTVVLIILLIVESIIMIFLYNSLTHQINDNIQQAEHNKAIIESYRDNIIDMLLDVIKSKQSTYELYEKWNNNFSKLIQNEKGEDTI